MLRFTIRELLLLTLVVALGVGWWVEHTDSALTRKERDRWQFQTEWLVAELKKEGVLIEIRDGVVEISGYSGTGFGNGPSAFKGQTLSPRPAPSFWSDVRVRD